MFLEKDFKKGSFLLEYRGDLITESEGKKREKQYDKAKEGSYLFFFQNKDKKLWFVILLLNISFTLKYPQISVGLLFTENVTV